MAKQENNKQENIAIELETKKKELEAMEEELKKKEEALSKKEQKMNETIEEIKAKEIKLNEVECDKESIDTAEQLKKDLVEIKIPTDNLNKNDKTVEVFINGYRWSIERGKEVKVPKAVKEILANAKYI